MSEKTSYEIALERIRQSPLAKFQDPIDDSMTELRLETERSYEIKTIQPESDDRDIARRSNPQN